MLNKSETNLRVGQIINALETGNLLEGEIEHIYADSVDLKNVILWSKNHDNCIQHEDCNIFFEQIC